ncbi:class D sortase [Parageobacillus toebii]|uniref:class D sortase n=1 Tax=Parageobacillus toebii TaxID=153151 RepID=UPI0035B51845
MSGRRKTYQTYGALVCMMIGLVMALWNGYAYWLGYDAVKPLKEKGKTPIARQMTINTAAKPEIGEQIGMLSIPKLGVSIPIYHGTEERQLRKGIGHYPKSALPGERDKNNMVLSGHRDTVFRQLGKIGVGDKLIVETTMKQFIYRVKKVRIVDENNRTVLVEKPRPTLTVTTCYPFHFIGKAKQRYVLIAQLVSTIKKKG